MQKYRYTVISCDFDNYEIIREIKNPLKDVEYIYVTNDPDATSKTWKIVYDNSYDTLTNSFDKVVEFRHRVLDYCHTDVCCRIDGSIQISGNAFDKTIDEFNNGGYDLAFIMHPWFNKLRHEYFCWQNIRNMPEEEVNLVKDFFTDNGYDFTLNTVYTLTMLIQRNNQKNKDINDKQYEVLCQLKKFCRSNNFHRCDQAIFTYTMDKYFSDTKVMPLHYTILERHEMCSIFLHKNNNVMIINKTLSIETSYKLFGKLVNTVFNGEKWLSLLTDNEIYKRAIKILLKTETNIPLASELSVKRIKDEDGITMCSGNIGDYYSCGADYNSSYRYTIDWYYKELLPVLIDKLKISYKENDFVEIHRNDVYCKIPKEIQELDIYCPRLRPNNGYIDVYYDTQSLHYETSMSVFMVDNVYEPDIFSSIQDDYNKIFKYCNFPVKIVNNTCKNNEAILIIGGNHTMPFISILIQYYHTVVIINNHLKDFTFDFMFSYIDFKNILILTQYDMYMNGLLKVTCFD